MNLGKKKLNGPARRKLKKLRNKKKIPNKGIITCDQPEIKHVKVLEGDEVKQREWVFSCEQPSCRACQIKKQDRWIRRPYRPSGIVFDLSEMRTTPPGLILNLEEVLKAIKTLKR